MCQRLSGRIMPSLQILCMLVLFSLCNYAETAFYVNQILSEMAEVGTSPDVPPIDGSPITSKYTKPHTTCL